MNSGRHQLNGQIFDFAVSRSVGITKRNAQLSSTTNNFFGNKKFVHKKNADIDEGAQSSQSRGNQFSLPSRITNNKKLDPIIDSENQKI